MPQWTELGRCLNFSKAMAMVVVANTGAIFGDLAMIPVTLLDDGRRSKN
jgi:hypothetical protein